MIDVHERHGIVKKGSLADQIITADEGDDCVRLSANDGIGARSVFLSPNEARHVATKLNRLARRIEERLRA